MNDAARTPAQSVKSLHLRGLEARNAGRVDEAIRLLQKALALSPSAVDIHADLGRVLGESGHHEGAADCFRQALRWRPDSALCHHNLAVALEGMDDYERAIGEYRRALRLNPVYPEAHNHLGHALRKAGREAEAVAAHRRALAIRPDYPEAYNGVGFALLNMRRVDEAIAALRTAIRLRPEYGDAHLNLATALLLNGELREGFAEYEWRFRSSQPPSIVKCDAPRWDGSDLGGRRILLHAEQGLGDTFQFVRYVPEVARHGGRVVLAVQRPLLRVLQSTEGVDEIVALSDAPQSCDLKCPLMGLPAVFRTTLETVPASAPYLRAEPDLVERWGRWLAKLPGYRVGINWSASATPWGQPRSIPLEHFRHLASVPRIQLYSLQKGGVEGEVKDSFPIQTLPGLDEDAAFVDTAAVMKCLDLVITADTSVAHLAGALGVPVWVLLRHNSEWRWLTFRNDSPWYPTMRLFRQPRVGAWEEVLEAVAHELKCRADSAGS